MRRGRGRGRATSSSTSISSSCSCSSSFDTSNNPASSFTHSQFKRDLSTDLRLGLSISPSSVSQQHNVPSGARSKQSESESDSLYSIKSLNPAPEEAMNLYAAGLADEDCNDPDHGHSNSTTMYVKVYMEGHGIGRKLDLLAHDGFHELIQTLGHMFNTNILWGDEVDRVHSAGHDVHVLTYEDEEGDWLMVGDVPWEMFLSTAKRLKITRTFPC